MEPNTNPGQPEFKASEPLAPDASAIQGPQQITSSEPLTQIAPVIVAPTEAMANAITSSPAAPATLEQIPAANPLSPTPQPAATPDPGSIFVGSGYTGLPETVSPSRRRFPLPLILGLVTLPLLAVLGSAYYFGYYHNSSYLYGQSLSNSGKGLTAIADSFFIKPKVAYQGYVGSGTYKVISDSFTTDGKIAFKTNKSSSETTFDIGAGTSRINVALRTIKSAGSSPDLFFKASGLNGLSSSLGQPELSALGTKYEDKWIVVDHTLFDNLQKQSVAASADSLPSSEQIMDEVHLASKVNQDYLFSNNKDRSATTVIKTYGLEKTEGHSVYHYQVGLNKANLKKYLAAQKQALLKSKLGAWITKNKLTADVDSSYQSAIASVDTIKSTDTFDIYSDVDSRLIYKVRSYSDPKNTAENYVDVGLDYKNSKILPFFLTGVSKSGNDKTYFSLKVKLTPDSRAVAVSLLVTGTGSTKMTIASDFSFNPTLSAPTIDTPTGAVQLAQLTADLGIGSPDSLFSSLATTSAGASSVSSGANDTRRKTDIAYLQSSLEEYASNHDGAYPTLAQINDPAYRKANINLNDSSALTDPDGSGTTLAAIPGAKTYAYQPLNKSGQACTNIGTNVCRSYTLTAILSSGATYARSS